MVSFVHNSRKNKLVHLEENRFIIKQVNRKCIFFVKCNIWDICITIYILIDHDLTITQIYFSRQFSVTGE